MKVRAILKNCRVTPRKARILIPLMKGVSPAVALVQLRQNPKRTSLPLEKLLMSAVANAEHNFQLNKEGLIVEDVIVNEGMRLKRWMPRAFGRASAIIKRTSHITVVLHSDENRIDKSKSPSKMKDLKETPKEDKKEDSEIRPKTVEPKKAKKEKTVKKVKK